MSLRRTNGLSLLVACIALGAGCSGPEEIGRLDAGGDGGARDGSRSEDARFVSDRAIRSRSSITSAFTEPTYPSAAEVSRIAATSFVLPIAVRNRARPFPSFIFAPSAMLSGMLVSARRSCLPRSESCRAIVSTTGRNLRISWITSE